MGNNSSLLHKDAMEANYSQLCHHLQSLSGKIDQQEDKYGWTALHIAAKKGFGPIVRELLAREARADLPDNNGGDGSTQDQSTRQTHISLTRERFVDDVVLDLPADKQVYLVQSPTSKQSSDKKNKKHKVDRSEERKSDPALTGNTGTTVWDGAILGAGTGAVALSLLACRRAKRAAITDIPDMLPHLRLNVDRNRAVLPKNGASAYVQALRWGPPGEDIELLSPKTASPFDVIVGADLIYYTYSEETPHTQQLLWTLEKVASPQSLIYLALSLHHNPEEVHHFLGLAAEKFEVVDLWKEVPEEWRVHDVAVVLLRLKANAAPEEGSECSRQQSEKDDSTDT
eukprot:gene22367-29469_t